MRLFFLASAALCLCDAAIFNIHIFREDAVQRGDNDDAQNDDNDVDNVGEDDDNQLIEDKQLTNRFVNGLPGALSPACETCEYGHCDYLVSGRCQKYWDGYHCQLPDSTCPPSKNCWLYTINGTTNNYYIEKKDRCVNDDNDATQHADNDMDKVGEDDDNQLIEDKKLTNRFVNGLQGALPPVIEESLTAKTCSCNLLLLSSLGPAQQHLPAILGVYKKYGEYNSKPVYFGPNSKSLYFLPSGWLVGDSAGAPIGLIHNANKSRSLCAYEIPSGWLFFSGQWYQDNTLVLRCIK